MKTNYKKEMIDLFAQFGEQLNRFGTIFWLPVKDRIFGGNRMSMKRNLIRGMQTIGEMRLCVGEWFPQTIFTARGCWPSVGPFPIQTWFLEVFDNVYEEEPDPRHAGHRRDALHDRRVIDRKHFLRHAGPVHSPSAPDPLLYNRRCDVICPWWRICASLWLLMAKCWTRSVADADRKL